MNARQKIKLSMLLVIVLTSSVVAADTHGWAGKQFTISPDDTLDISVLNHQGISGVYRLTSGGVSLPGIGTFKAAGEKPPHLSRLIATALGAPIDGAEVKVSIVSNQRVYFCGEVRNPRSYPLTPLMTVTEAIQLAGGLTDFAKKRAISIARGGQRINFDLNAVAKGQSPDLALQSGDVILVP